MELEEAKRAVLDASKKLVDSSLVARTWGNISCRVGSSHFLITPSGREYERLDEGQLVLVSLEDLSYEGEIKPSSEKGIHGAVYRLREDVHSVIHTHQEMASLASQLGEVLAVPPAFQHILGERILTAPYALPGTKRLKAQVSKVLATEPKSSLLMAHHGALCFAGGMEETYRAAAALEAVCTEHVHSRAPRLGDLAHSGEPVLLARRNERGDIECSDDAPLYIKELACALLAGKRGYTHVLSLSSPKITASMENVQTLSAYLDDFAQIAGANVPVMEGGRAPSAYLSATKGRDALLIRGFGALCMGTTQSDAKAVATLLEKNAKAALLALDAPQVRPLPLLDSHLMRFVYTHKYSKLAEADPPSTPSVPGHDVTPRPRHGEEV